MLPAVRQTSSRRSEWEIKPDALPASASAALPFLIIAAVKGCDQTRHGHKSDQELYGWRRVLAASSPASHAQ